MAKEKDNWYKNGYTVQIKLTNKVAYADLTSLIGEDCIDWLRDNVVGLWRAEIDLESYEDFFVLVYYFEREDDALLFKLR